MYEMKKGTLIMLIAIVWLTLLNVGLSVSLITDKREEIIRTEVYQSSDEYLVVQYPKKADGFDFTFSQYFANGGHAHGAATYVSENEAVLDNLKGIYFRFVFIKVDEEQILELYSRDGLMERYRLIVGF